MVSGQFHPREITSRLWLGFGLGLELVLGLGAIFLGGNCPRTCFDNSVLFKNSEKELIVKELIFFLLLGYYPTISRKVCYIVIAVIVVVNFLSYIL